MSDVDVHSVKATRELTRDSFDDIYGQHVEGVTLLEYSKDGVVVDVLKQTLPHPLPEGYVERWVHGIEYNGHTYVVAYEVVPESERLREALILSARSKLTNDEYEALRGSCRS